MLSKTIVTGLVWLLCSCQQGNSQRNNEHGDLSGSPLRSNDSTALPFNVSAIPAPPGFKRTGRDESSFAKWLGKTRLKRDKTVYLYNGSVKPNQQAQFAVLDVPVGKKNLQQCADAVMRLRASYLFDQGRFDEIVFYDNERKPYAFSKPYTEDHLNNYLERVFGSCGTASLQKQMKTIPANEVQPGDVLIRGGFPGHAVIVMDMAVNEKGVKKYLIAQSYMPAQDIHVLVNPLDAGGQPWYELKNEGSIITPEYRFNSSEWKQW